MLEMARLSLIKQTEDAAAKRALATHLAALHKTENNYAERPEPARVDLCASFAAWAEQTASQQVPCLARTHSLVVGVSLQIFIARLGFFYRVSFFGDSNPDL
jgi:hypothetical protein